MFVSLSLFFITIICTFEAFAVDGKTQQPPSKGYSRE
ncbi:hypothetical protein PC116_g28815 [Phytophthora cactorum]|nr:hypothetical protein PC116_g28815 [Phytophthora cactorum]